LRGKQVSVLNGRHHVFMVNRYGISLLQVKLTSSKGVYRI
jgi:hypothetical protein